MNPPNFLTVLPSFDGASVLTIGDVILDQYWIGDASRISAEAPVPIVTIEEREARLGGAANVALNVATLGGRSALIGLCGDDENASILEAKCKTAGINPSLVRLHDYPTITKLRIMSRQQQLIRADDEEMFPATEAELVAKYHAAAAGYNAVVLSDYDKGTLSDPQLLIRAVLDDRKLVLVDPKYKNFECYRGVTMLKPNLKEFEAAVGECRDESDMRNKALSLIEQLELGALLVTRHSDGMTLYFDGESHHLPARKREVYDVTGAGDTVIAIMASAMSVGATMLEAIDWATYAAGIVVTQSGTTSVSEAELRLEMANELSVGKGMMSAHQLKDVVDVARRQGERIVFTNGCFDILHAGHVSYLEEARQHGDRLIVAINDDDGVTRLKGSGRPINPVDRRMTMLAGLAAVDWVTSFSEDTPEALLAELKPDVLVKGGDYQVHEVVGADIVRNYGGDVKVLQLVQGTSTTLIAEKIRSL